MSRLQRKLHVLLVSVLAVILFGAPRLFAQALPDLSIAEIVVPGGAWSGEEGCNTVRVTVRNSQNVGVSEPIYVHLFQWVPDYNSDSRIEILRGGIGPNGSLPVTFKNVPLIGGPLKAHVDYKSTIGESNENNNTRDHSYSFQGPCHTFTIADVDAKEGEQLIFTVNRTGSLASVAVPFQVTALRSRDAERPHHGICNRAVKGMLPDYYVPPQRSVYFREGARTSRIGVTLCSDQERDPGERIQIQLLKDGSPYPGGRTTAVAEILEPKTRTTLRRQR